MKAVVSKEFLLLCTIHFLKCCLARRDDLNLEVIVFMAIRDQEIIATKNLRKHSQFITTTRKETNEQIY